jgi:hypothetical protein
MATKKPTQHDKLDMILAKLEILLNPGKVEFGDGKPPATGAASVDPPAVPTLEEIAPWKLYAREIEECGGVAAYIARIKARVPNYIGDLAVYTDGEKDFMEKYPRLFLEG